VNTLKRHLSVANVLSLIALFVALSASAVAATKLGAGQVKSYNIANQAVTNPKIKTQAVTSGKIKNLGINSADLGTGSVINSKLKNKAVTTNKIGTEAVGTGNLAKNSVITGKIGPEAVASGKIANEAITSSKLAASLYAQLVRNVSYQNSSSASNSEANKTATATCPSGKEAIGGGVRLEGELAEVAVTGSYPVSSGESRTGWEAIAHETGTGQPGDWSVEAFVVCAEL
jgi:hypothetical protein